MSKPATGVSSEPAAGDASESKMSISDELLRDIMLDPASLHDMDLTAEQMADLAHKVNPYARVAPQPANGVYKSLIMSITDINEKYQQRFTMTSLTGFIFKVLSEWTPSAVCRRWLVNTAPVPAAPGPGVVGPAAVEQAQRAGAASEMANRVAQQAIDLDKARSDMAQITADLNAAKLSDEPEKVDTLSKSLTAVSEYIMTAERNLAILNYVAQHAMYTAGKFAQERIHASAEKLPADKAREIMRDNPPPLRVNQMEVPVKVAKDIVNTFLTEWLVYDPNQHVKSALDPKSNYVAQIDKIRNSTTCAAHPELSAAVGPDGMYDPHDPAAATYAALKNKPAVGTDGWSSEHCSSLKTLSSADPSVRRLVVRSLLLGVAGQQDEVRKLRTSLANVANALADAENDPKKFAEQLARLPQDTSARNAIEHIPPRDTYHRWLFYQAVNYDALRQITDALYPERDYFDKCIMPLKVLEGTKDEIDAAFKKYISEHESEFTTEIISVQFGAWSVTTSTKNNRDKLQYFNRSTEALKRIADRQSEDQKLGRELMKNRVLKKKADNIASEGPDAPGLDKYRSTIGPKSGDAGLSAKERAQLAKADGNIARYRELMNVDSLEEELRSLTALEERGAALTEHEKLRRRELQREIKEAHEQLDVPEKHIQCDAFVTDAASGTVTKNTFYIPAVEPEEPATEAAKPGPAVRKSGE